MPSEKRFLQVDGLRGIAIMIVLLFHYLNNAFLNNSELNLFENLISKITSYGWAGVNLFFVISGFLIGTILLKNRKATNFFKTFYIRRVLRIIPLYYTFLLIYFLSNLLFQSSDLVLFEKPISIWKYFVFIQNFSMSSMGHFGPNALTPTWSLAIEEQFYLVIPFLFYFFDTKKLITISFLLIIFSVYFRINSVNWYMEYTHFFSRIDSPLIGIIVSIIYFNSNETFNLMKGKNFKYFTVILVAILILFLIKKQINHTLISYVFGGLLLFSLQSKPNKIVYKIIVNNFTLFLGKYSYFIYLFHQLINGMFFGLVFHCNPVLNTYNDYLMEVISLFSTLFLAIISFKYYESKFIDKGQKISYN
jgi:peptidoglycan/LPS O-acetylase OafA/YrhL